jgi:hypothetical protein
VLRVEVLPTGFAGFTRRLVVLGIIDAGRVSGEENFLRYPPPELRYVYLKWLGDRFDPDAFDPQKDQRSTPWF